MVAALDGHDAFTVMSKMSAAAELLGATDAERKAALATQCPQLAAPTHPYGGAHAATNAPGSCTFVTPETMAFQQQQQHAEKPKRGTKRKASDSRLPAGVKFLGKYVRVWWDAPYNSFFVGRVDHYSGEEQKYKVIYNQGTPDEEFAFEDLESMKAAHCKILPAPKLPASVAPELVPAGGASGLPSATTPFNMLNIEKRIKKAKTLYEIETLEGEISAHMRKINDALKMLDEQSDEERDDLNTGAALPAANAGHQQGTTAPDAPFETPVGAQLAAPSEVPPAVPPAVPREEPLETTLEAPIGAPIGAPLEASVGVLTEVPASAPAGTPLEVPTEAPPMTPVEPATDRANESPLAAVTVTPQQPRRETPPAARSPRALALEREEYVNTVPAPEPVPAPVQPNVEHRTFGTPMIQMLIDAPERMMYTETTADEAPAVHSDVDLVAADENLSDV